MVVLLHGAAGGWDELAIAVAAFVVLWIAVKIAGRKPAADDEDDELVTAELSEPVRPDGQTSPAQPSSTKLG